MWGTGEAQFQVAIVYLFRVNNKKSYFGMSQGRNGRILAYKWDMLLYSDIKLLVKSKLGKYSVVYGSIRFTQPNVQETVHED